MKAIVIGTCTALLILSRAAGAHSHLASSEPKENSTLSSAPREIVLNFAHPVRITALKVRRADEDPKPIKALPTSFDSSASIPISIAGEGRYTVEWRAVSTDGHVMHGAIHFTVSGKAAGPSR